MAIHPYGRVRGAHISQLEGHLVLGRIRCVGIERLANERLEGLLLQLETQLPALEALHIEQILDYNKDPLQGIANAVFATERPDSAFIERLLTKCNDHLSLLAAPATLERVYDFGVDAFDAIFDTMRLTTPVIVLDIPHQWSGWTRRALVGADDILIVAEPYLANLRNAKNMVSILKAARPLGCGWPMTALAASVRRTT